MANELFLAEVAHASKKFTDERGIHTFAFRDVSFDVRAGEFLSIVGPSGCGKSTLLRAFADLIPLSEGAIERRFKKPAMVFQNFALFPWLRVRQNVEFGLAMAGVAAHTRRHTAEEKLREAGLAGFEKHFPRELSGGERQRVGLARALALSPDLLLMDEPFSSLDSIIAEKLKADVAQLWQRYGMTVIMVNHLIADAIQLSDRIVVMGGEPGTVKATLAVTLPRPRDARSAEFFALQDKITGLLSS